MSVFVHIVVEVFLGPCIVRLGGLEMLIFLSMQ